MSPALIAFVASVSAAGGLVIAHSVLAIHPASLNLAVVGLAALTIASGRFAIKIPGRPATVSVSEVFVFTSILLFGSAVPVLTVAVDGLWISLTQKDRRIYRALFNIAEPAISTWTAAQVFSTVLHAVSAAPTPTSAPIVLPAIIAMAAAFFGLNSGLSALAVALENRTSAYDFWRGHAWYLAVNYYAAASVAALAVSGPRINFGVAVLVLPLLLLSYVAYREASTRVDEATRHVTDVEHLYRASVEMLAIAVDAKDQVTHGHIRRVQRHTLDVASALGVTDLRELKAIEAGALLHDIGKLAVPDYVLNKPSALTNAEFETMKKHSTMGARILTAVDFPYPIVPIVRHHHERWDGRGYPDGLVGAEIPLGARILAVVDCFDALTSDRPYRARLTDTQAIEMLRARRGSFYDPTVVDTFIELVPRLRQGDASGQQGNPHAAVVAGLARTPAPSGEDTEPCITTTAAMAMVPSIAQELVDMDVARLPGAEACLFALDGSQGTLLVAHATPRLRAAVVDLRLSVGTAVSGWVAANRSTIRRAEATLDLGHLADMFALRTCASLPVISRADLFGVLTVYAADADLLDDSVDAIGLLAQEVGLIIARHAAASAHSSWRESVRPVIAAAS
ncbi:MAG TPA: HD domain-containing phosphohydrolase [Vicinamibacterales bacterium]|nr:HD domain-containing phosphohydrolase [Vicinamibacterales bacterium]